MPFFALLYVASVVTTTFAADSAQKLPDSTPIILRFPDDNHNFLPLTTTIGEIQWSTTIKNAAEELGTGVPIPVHNVDKSIFECLNTAMIKTSNPLCLRDPKNESDRRTFKGQLLTCIKSLNRTRVLVQANYLDVAHQFKTIITEEYVFTLKNPSRWHPHIPSEYPLPVITMDDNKKIVFDNLPHELEPIIAGQLGQTLLRIIKPVTQTQSLDDYNQSSVIDGPIISNCSDEGSFACVWEERGDAGNDVLYQKLCIVNQACSTHKICEIYSLGDLKSNNPCTLSHDGHYLLLVTYCALKELIQIYDIQNTDLQKPDSKRTGYSIVATLFNDTTQKFHVIAKDDVSPAKTLHFHFLTVDPTKPLKDQNWDTHPKPKSPGDRRFRWSCVHGDLVGTDMGQNSGTIVVYKENKLLEYTVTSDPDDPCTYKYSIDGKAATLDYGFISKNRNIYVPNNVYATDISYIPDLLLVAPTLPDPSPEYRSSASFPTYHSPFDAHHLCINTIHNGSATTHHMLPQNCRKMLNLCSKKLHTGDTNILPYMYAAYWYYNAPASWKAKCSDFLEHLPEIEQILEAGNQNNDAATTSCNIS